MYNELEEHSVGGVYDDNANNEKEEEEDPHGEGLTPPLVKPPHSPTAV